MIQIEKKMHLVAFIFSLNPIYFQKEEYIITIKVRDTVNLCKGKYTSRLRIWGDNLTTQHSIKCWSSWQPRQERKHKEFRYRLLVFSSKQ